MELCTSPCAWSNLSLRHLQARHGVRRSSMATTQSRGMVRSKGRDVDGIEQDAAGAGVEFSPQLRSRLYRIGLIMACPPLATSVLDSSSSALALDGNAAAIAAAAMSEPWTSSASFELVHRLVGVPLADLDPDTAKLAITVLGPFFAFFNLLFIFRIVMSWYPQIPVSKFPFVLAYAPTEPILGPTRRLIPPVGGVDVAPVIWVALMSFLNEILLGKQGLFILLSQQQS